MLKLSAWVSQKGVDKEFFLLFSVMDENLSQYLRDNINMFTPNTTDPSDEDFMESNMMHGMLARIFLSVTRHTSHFCYRVFWTTAINGRMYGNLAGLEMCAGDKVMWYTFGLGTEVDIHGVYFEGNTFKKQSTTRDTLNLFPHTTTAVSMQPNEPGWSDYITYARAETPTTPPVSFCAIKDDEMPGLR